MSSGPLNPSRPSNAVTQGQRSRKQVTTNMTQQHALLCLSDSIGLEVLSQHYTCFSGSRRYSHGQVPWGGAASHAQVLTDTRHQPPLTLTRGHLNPGPGSCLHGAAPRALLNNSISTILQPALGPLTETQGRGFEFQPLPWSWVFSSPGGDQWPVPVFTPTPSPPRLLILNILSCSQARPEPAAQHTLSG